MAPPVALLSGDRGVGKSTLALRLAHALQKDHGAESVAGVVTERSGSMRTALLLPANDRMPLAADTRGSAGGAAGFTGPVVGPFRFSRTTIEAVNDLFTAGSPGLAAPRRLWILDEVGPLELRNREGFLPAFHALTGTTRTAALIVVRPVLLAEVRDAFQAHTCAVHHLTADTRDLVYRALSDSFIAWLNGSTD